LKSALTPDQLEALRRLSTCAVSNAIEAFDVRLHNAGFADASIRCIFKDFPPIVGYAATARVRTSVPPMHGHNYFDRTDWWNTILKIPAPRGVVFEDVEKRPALGSFVGEVHSNILGPRGCGGGHERRGPRPATSPEHRFPVLCRKRRSFPCLCPYFSIWNFRGDRRLENRTGGFAPWRPARNSEGSAGDSTRYPS
jgi:hypothetical protein